MTGTCEGKVAIVTGSSRGIGAAVAARLAAAGARVALSARTLEPDPRYEGSLVETAAAIRAAGGEVATIRCDISKADDRARLVEETVAQLGPVDILVNNAAVTFMDPFLEFSRKRFDLMVDVQLWAPFELAQAVVPGMKERGEGWILNITSRAAVHPVGPPYNPVHDRGFAVYGMVKAGFDRLTTALSAELYRDNIAVNALAPWDNVATPGAGHHDLVEGFALEGTEWMAEAALALCSAPPRQRTGRVAYSQPFLHELQIRPKTT